MTVHHQAARGFEAGAEVYQRARPSYPEAAVNAALAELRLGPGERLLELGAGTGKFSRLVADRGLEVVALEPVAAMRSRLRGMERVVPVGGAAEALPFQAGSFGGVAAATAFHWFDGPRALREIHRVLRPGGRLVLLWNRRDEEAAGWIARLGQLVNRMEGEAPRYRSGRWRAAFEAATELFAPCGDAHVRHVQLLPPEGVVDRVASISFVAALPEADRARLLDQVRALLASDPETAESREIPLAYVADLFAWQRNP